MMVSRYYWICKVNLKSTKNCLSNHVKHSPSLSFHISFIFGFKESEVVKMWVLEGIIKSAFCTPNDDSSSDKRSQVNEVP